MFSGRRIRFSLGKTINLGNFESLRIDYGEEVDVVERANISEARLVLQDRVITELQKIVDELAPKPKKMPRGHLVSEEEYG